MSWTYYQDLASCDLGVTNVRRATDFGKIGSRFKRSEFIGSLTGAQPYLGRYGRICVIMSRTASCMSIKA